jgi:hypothetical protein
LKHSKRGPCPRSRETRSCTNLSYAIL